MSFLTKEGHFPGTDPAWCEGFLESIRCRSRPLRHLPLRTLSPDPALAGFPVVFEGYVGGASSGGFRTFAAMGTEVCSAGAFQKRSLCVLSTSVTKTSLA